MRRLYKGCHSLQLLEGSKETEQDRNLSNNSTAIRDNGILQSDPSPPQLEDSDCTATSERQHSYGGTYRDLPPTETARSDVARLARPIHVHYEHTLCTITDGTYSGTVTLASLD